MTGTTLQELEPRPDPDEGDAAIAEAKEAIENAMDVLKEHGVGTFIFYYEPNPISCEDSISAVWKGCGTIVRRGLFNFGMEQEEQGWE